MNFNPNMNNNSVFGQNNIKNTNSNLANIQSATQGIQRNVSIFSSQITAKSSTPGGIFAQNNGISATNYSAFSASAQGKVHNDEPKNIPDEGFLATLKSMFMGEPKANKGDTLTNARLILAQTKAATSSGEAQELLQKQKEKEENGGKTDEEKGQKLNIDMA